MTNAEDAGRILNAVGWGLLCILWGLTILVDAVPFAAGLLATGLILLGANLVRMRSGLLARDENTLLGVLALAWGGLELARPMLGGLFQFTDWAVFAILLVVLGTLLLTRGLLLARRTRIEEHRETAPGGGSHVS